ncbi:MAG: DNA primase [Spirochaetaceae bacterium]
MGIPKSTIAEIREKADILAIVGQYVQLQRRGNRYWGLSPFTNEKTPSFAVEPEKGLFYCFSSRKGGTVFDFIQEVERVSFPEAARLLAKRVGVEIPEGQGDAVADRRLASLRELYNRVTNTFHYLLTEADRGEEARRYMNDRGIDRETIETFRIGYAPQDPHWLHRFLLKKGYSPEFLAESGLFSKRRADWAFFRNRIMFPIATATGDVVAFGARELGQGGPKYINSAESELFRKRDTLFGFSVNRRSIGDEGTVVVVEGYFDVVALRQAGIKTAVAPLGTQFTDGHARVVRRYAQKGILVFDADAAGARAAEKSAAVFERHDLACAVAELPAGNDPADLVQSGDLATLRSTLDQAEDAFSYLLRKAAEEADLATAYGKGLVMDRVFSYIREMRSEVRRETYLSELADRLDVPLRALRSDYESAISRGVSHRQAQSGTNGGPDTAVSRERKGVLRQSPELFLMLAAGANPPLFSRVRRDVGVDDIEDGAARELYVALEESYRRGENDIPSFLDRIEEPELRSWVSRRLVESVFAESSEETVDETIRTIRLRKLRTRQRALDRALRKAEQREGDDRAVEELLHEKMHINDEISKIEELSKSKRVVNDGTAK